MNRAPFLAALLYFVAVEGVDDLHIAVWRLVDGQSDFDHICPDCHADHQSK